MAVGILCGRRLRAGLDVGRVRGGWEWCGLSVLRDLAETLRMKRRAILAGMDVGFPNG